MDLVDSGSAQIALLAQVKNDVKLAQTLGACGFAICLWDTLAYLHQEYRLVWEARWSPMKVAYLFTRYCTIICGALFFVGFFASFSESACNNFVKAMPAMGTLPLLGCTGVLIVRAHALWDNNKAVSPVMTQSAVTTELVSDNDVAGLKMLAFMIFLASLQEVGTLVVALRETSAVPIIAGAAKACVPTSASGLYSLYWIFPLVVHTFIFIFSFAKAWDLVHSNCTDSNAFQKLYKVMVNGYGMLFPFLMIVVELVQVVFYLAADKTLRAACSPLSGFIVTVLACQMVLVLKLNGKRGSVGDSSNSSANSHIVKQSTNLSGFHGGKLSGIHAFVQSHQVVDGGDGSPSISHQKFGSINAHDGILDIGRTSSIPSSAPSTFVLPVAKTHADVYGEDGDRTEETTSRLSLK